MIPHALVILREDTLGQPRGVKVFELELRTDETGKATGAVPCNYLDVFVAQNGFAPAAQKILITTDAHTFSIPLKTYPITRTTEVLISGSAPTVTAELPTTINEPAHGKGAPLAQKRVAADECERTSRMRVYSNVFVHKETGDVLGYDLAINDNGGSGVDALLHVYEGGNSDPGIPLSGQISNNRLSVQGTWVEHLVEYPSRKDIVETHFVKIVGTLDGAEFHGELAIEGMGEQEKVQLKRVKRIWSCQKWNPSRK